MQRQAVEGVGLTPVELKKSVLACGELNFLHNKVTAIDESDIKYRKPARGGKKRILKAAAKDGDDGNDNVTVTEKAASLITKARALEVEEDDDYDESDSDA
ncbi:cAMP-specific 3' [Phytophthora nicotianae]|uniref:cAMP-specific 3 n=1 Tax=Phytophthora nicotianae TaxID=4792 RepID=A0A0W8DGE5_PHYNI|nr:cAMP-specific 3' [Phytophthora nicotianae]